MKYKILPNTSLNVSEICLGTMTWGEQNNENEGHTQLNYSLTQGVNFIDTAEMYSVPASPLTQGKTEEIIGSWFTKNKTRDQVILATKVAGPSRGFQHIREQLDFSADSIEDALHNSLRRLETDYIDLYQLHWPERSVNIFGVREYNYDQNEQWEDNIAAIIERLEKFVNQGKIRHIGLSNETPFGLMRYMEEARKGATKMVSVQNAYNILNRRDEIGLTEVLHKENIGYLPYSPLAFGQLTGKYLHGATPEKARVTLFPNYSRYQGEASFKATIKYYDLAKKHGLSLTQMSLAFVRQQPFVTSTIIGATTIEQLSENIASVDVVLSEEILNEINDIHRQIPNPAP